MHNPNQDITVHCHSEFRHVVVIPNATAQNSSLSWAARGLLCHMLSLPPTWKFHEADLINRSPGGRDHLRSVVRELESHGYLTRTQTRDHQGRTGSTRWDVYAVPQAPAPQTGNPSPENPFTAETLSTTGFSPQTGNPSTDQPLTAKPLTGYPSTENPSAYKNHIEQKPHPPSSSLRSEETPPQGERPPAAADEHGRGKSRKSVRIDPATAELPQALEQHRQGIADFWAAKRTGSARTAAAFTLLVKNLERIQAQDPGAVASQLEAATQAGWRSITFDNWSRYGRETHVSRPAYKPHTTRQMQNAAGAIALIHAQERARAEQQALMPEVAW